MQFIKGGFSFRLKSKLDVWMRSFNETQIMSKEKYVHCVSYIEDNPVRRRLASTPGAYCFSSANGGPFDAMPVHLALKRPGPKGPSSLRFRAYFHFVRRGGLRSG